MMHRLRGLEESRDAASIARDIELIIGKEKKKKKEKHLRRFWTKLACHVEFRFVQRGSSTTGER